MGCKQCQELLSDYIDGALELGEQVNIERHLGDCEPCRAVRDDLLQIVHFSHQLPMQAPSAALWPRISSDLAELQPTFWTRTLRWLASFRTLNFNFSVPQLVAGVAALVIVASIGVMLSRRDNPQPELTASSGQLSMADVRPLSQTDLQQLEKQISQLSQTVEQRKEAWDPELRTAFERNLLYIDQSLVECRHQLKDNPSDNVSQELMLNAYREKVRLLEGFEKF
ncbi:MAG TPA: zf-HC2 domain-containing protein [Blastocatellia bacterium]|nr:zf-HC2 domain-containing protein [Blastocatellia bacterium]